MQRGPGKRDRGAVGPAINTRVWSTAVHITAPVSNGLSIAIMRSPACATDAARECDTRELYRNGQYTSRVNPRQNMVQVNASNAHAFASTAPCDDETAVPRVRASSNNEGKYKSCGVVQELSSHLRQRIKQ